MSTPTEVRLPDSAWEGVDAGVQALLDQWLVAPGDAVQAGQPLGRAVLVKASLELTAPCAGRVDKLLVAAGDNFARGQAVATLSD